MRKPRTTIAITTALAAWAETQAQANGLSVSAYVATLLLREQGSQTAQLQSAADQLRHRVASLETTTREVLAELIASPHVSEVRKQLLASRMP